MYYDGVERERESARGEGEGDEGRKEDREQARR